MAGDEKSQTLERLAKLTVEDQPSTEPHVPADGNVQSPPVPTHGRPVANHSNKPEDDRVDMAIKQALEDSKERATVLSIEEQVEKFILDTKQQLLEFPSSFSNYQRMLAHRIAQHYGLQTSTVDYEDGPGRVIARRTPWCRQPPLKVKLADLKPSAFRGAGAVPKVLVRRPASEDSSTRAGTSGASTSQPATSQSATKDREEDYNQARERIIGKSLDSVNMRAANGSTRGRGYMGGRGGYNAAPRSPGGGRGARKAVFRDRDKELQDPDYRRGTSRYPGKADADGRGEVTTTYPATLKTELSRPSTSSSTGPPKSPSPVPTSPARSYSSEYNSWNSKGYRAPPPPPMNSPGPHAKNYHHHHHPQAQHPGLAMPRPYAPYAMAPYPVPAMGMAYHPGLAAGPTAAHAYMPPFGAFPFHQYQMMAPGPEGLHMGAPYQYYAPYAQHAYPTHFAHMPALPPPPTNNEKIMGMPPKSHGGSSIHGNHGSQSSKNSAASQKVAPPLADDGEKK